MNQLQEYDMSQEAIISFHDVSKSFGNVKAVNNANFKIERGEFFALLGPSGCGKTTLLRMVAGFEIPDSGEISIDNQLMSGIPPNLRPVNMVFQNYAIFPHMDVRGNIAFGMRKSGLSKTELNRRIDETLELIKLQGYGKRRAEELSGGQRQRVALASALAVKPKLIVLDEPVSALDVSIRAQMMNLLKDIQTQENVAYLLVAHDLATVRHMADWTAVMYLGQIVEYAPTAKLFENVQHPYTKALFSAVLPDHPDRQQDEIILPGEVPSPLNPPSGCRFHTRCPYVMEQCSQVEPPVRVSTEGHRVACHLEALG